MNAIGYRRLSERDQSNYSLEYQESTIRDYCRKNDLELIGLYTDNGQSSYTFDRPDYKALESFLKKHKGKARYLIIMDHDRFSRNLTEALAKINELEDKFGIKVLATNEAIDLDPSDPFIFLQRSMNYMFANAELLKIRKRTRDGIRQAQSSGRHVNNAPYGYLNAKDSEDKGIIIVEDERAMIVQMIFREYLDGTPVFMIHKKAREMGFKNTGNSAIPRILSNPIYAGMVKVSESRNQPERLVKGLHQPLVSEADYWLVQEKLGNKRSTKTQPKIEFPLRGTLKCWCGKSMTAGFSKGKNKYYLYYRCTVHNSKNYSGDELHRKFEELLDCISFTPAQVKKISVEAHAIMTKLVGNSTAVIESRTRQIADVNQKIERLEERLMNDEIDGDTYKKWFQKYRTERAMLADEIVQAKNNDSTAQWEKLRSHLDKLNSLKEVYWLAVQQNKQKQFIQGVFKHNLTYSEGIFRTPSIAVPFIDNSLKAKEKGLLLLEQPSDVWDKVPDSSP